MAVRSYRAGDSLEDVCRSCKTDRMHTVIAADSAGLPLRVVCGYCQSEHNYRGGPRVAPDTRTATWGGEITAPAKRRKCVCMCRDVPEKKG